MKIYARSTLGNGDTKYHFLRKLKLWPLDGNDLLSQIERAMHTPEWIDAEQPILVFSKTDYNEIVMTVSRIAPYTIRSIGPSDCSSSTIFAISPDNVGGILAHALEHSGLKVLYIPCTIYGEPDVASCAPALIHHNFLCCVYKSKKK